MSVKVRNLSKFYGSTKAVNNISFDVNTGEILGFLGPNGAGKTTTMKIITCFLPPNDGTVEVDGLSIYEHSLEVRKNIGYLPEHNPLYLDMNVLDFLGFSAKLHGLTKSKINQRMKEMVDVCGLGDVRHKDIGELSKGYRQRVGLAQAMIHDPNVLILDEPTSGLDPNQIVEIRNLIKTIGLAKTVILSTHILSEVQATCDRVIIINSGEIAADSTTDKLREEFRGSEIITLTLKSAGDDPMNSILPKLKSIPDIENAEFAGEEADSFKFILRSPKGTDCRENIFNWAVANSFVILEMNRDATSLEEVFHKLTRSGDKFTPSDNAKYMPQAN
jgi:ABC-2 type transport system ATP-binding protein